MCGGGGRSLVNENLSSDWNLSWKLYNKFRATIFVCMVEKYHGEREIDRDFNENGWFLDYLFYAFFIKRDAVWIDILIERSREIFYEILRKMFKFF